MNLQLTVPSNSLEAYIQGAHSVPVLSAQRELELFDRFKSQGDLDAAREIVLAHLRFVVKVARGYSGYGLSQADLIQEGNIGLMKAVKRFDPSVGVRLVSFAVHWVRAEIHEYIIKNWRIVKVATTKAQRKLFFNLRSSKKHLGWFSQEEIKSVAEDLGVSTRDVIEMEKRMSAHDASYDPKDNDDDNTKTAPTFYLEDSGNNPEDEIETLQTKNIQSENLALALASLDNRSRDIISQRWLNPEKQTLHDLANQYGVSAERIRQIEQSAMKKLRQAFPSLCS